MIFSLDDIRTDISRLEGIVPSSLRLPKADEAALHFRLGYADLYRHACVRRAQPGDKRERIMEFMKRYAIPRIDTPLSELKTAAFAHLYWSENPRTTKPRHSLYKYKGPLGKNDDGDINYTGQISSEMKTVLIIYSDPFMGVQMYGIEDSQKFKNKSVV